MKFLEFIFKEWYTYFGFLFLIYMMALSIAQVIESIGNAIARCLSEKYKSKDIEDNEELEVYDEGY